VTTVKALRECKHPAGCHLEFCQLAKSICRIAKCGEDVLNHSRAIASCRFLVPYPFLSLNFDLDLSKYKVTFGPDVEHPCDEHSTSMF